MTIVQSRKPGIAALQSLINKLATARLLGTFVMLAACAGLVHAADLGDAERLYQAGRFAKAAELGRATGGAEGHALAAKATLVQAVYLAPEDDAMALFRRAAGDARNALARNPDHVDAHLQLAIALGYIGEHKGPITAHLDGYAHEAKEHIDRALALAPEHAWTHGVLGVWHLQIVRHGGPDLAAEIYAASRKKGRAHCTRAKELAPDELALRYGCALSLLELDAKAFGKSATRELEHIARAAPDDAAERLVQREVLRLLKRSGQDPAS